MKRISIIMRKIVGWILLIAGSIYLILLAFQGIDWLVSKQPVHIHIPLLVGSITICFIGIWLKEKKQEGLKPSGP